ncbi:MAG: sigma-70 family RNA polymerase sigma factor [Bacteroidetes bacterium]|jgi:RNA polymerase sigma factor (sigma-70 family)|nr:sigma-70 family RNA polymerase sigma factor [Bacteroidota bacterium]
MKTIVSAQMAEKNKQTLASSVKQYGAQLAGFIRSKVGNNEDAKDILQDVWYQFSRLTNLDDIENISGWLYNVSRNRITDNYRKKKPASLEDFKVNDDENLFSFKEILLIDDSGNPELALFKNLFWEELMSALDELPEKQREVFVLNEMEDKTLKEIAEETNENLKTIISRKGYAVKHLRKRLDYLYKELNN